MAIFLFGLNEYTAVLRHEEKKGEILGSQSPGELANKLASEPGNHVLPLLSGDPEALAIVRTRYLKNLSKAFPIKDLEASLRLELLNLGYKPSR